MHHLSYGMIRILLALGAIASPIALLALIIGMLKRSFLASAAVMLSTSAGLWFLLAFLYCSIAVYLYFGIRSLIIGLFLAVVGIVPYGLIGFAARGYWEPFGTTCVLLTLGIASSLASWRFLSWNQDAED